MTKIHRTLKAKRVVPFDICAIQGVFTIKIKSGDRDTCMVGKKEDKQWKLYDALMNTFREERAELGHGSLQWIR